VKIRFKVNTWKNGLEFMSPDFSGYVHLNRYSSKDYTDLFNKGIVRFRERYFRRYS